MSLARGGTRWYPRPALADASTRGSAWTLGRAWAATGCPISTSSRLEETACSTDAGAMASSGASAPLGDRLRSLGVSPDALTVFGLLASAATAVLIATGSPRLGRGRRHRRRGQRPARRRDRARQRPGEPARRVLRLGGRPRLRRAAPRRLRLVARRQSPRTCRCSRSRSARCSMVISYERARAEALGINARGGLMERAERFVFLEHRPRLRHPRPGAVGDARAHRVHGGRPLPPRLPAGGPPATVAHHDPPHRHAHERLGGVHPDRIREWWAVPTRRRRTPSPSHRPSQPASVAPVRGRSDHCTRLSGRGCDRADAARGRRRTRSTPRSARSVARRFMHGRAGDGRAAPASRGTGLRREAAVAGVFDSYAQLLARDAAAPGRRPPRCWSHSASGSTATNTSKPGSRRGNGVILALPHLGGWEYGAAGMALLGHRMLAVVEPIEPPELYDWFVDQRRGDRPRRRPARSRRPVPQVLARAARQPHRVPAQRSRHHRRRGRGRVLRRAHHAPGRARDAGDLRTGAALLPVAVYFRAGHVITIAFVRPPLSLRTGGPIAGRCGAHHPGSSPHEFERHDPRGAGAVAPDAAQLAE